MEYYSINAITKDRSYYKSIDFVKSTLEKGGLVIIPTDTIYCFCCLSTSKKALIKISQLKGIKPKASKFSIMIDDLGKLNAYVKPFSRSIFKVVNRNLPGPFTFIFTANNYIPKLFNSNRKEIGIRLPNDDFCIDLLKELNEPLIVSSVTKSDYINKHYNDPFIIENDFKSDIDLLIDAGIRSIDPSTVVSCINDEIEIVRHGIGDLDL